MNNSIYRFNLELHSTMSQVSVPALIGDTSREFRITLSDGGKPYIIEDGCTAYITIKRPTGTHLTKGCIVEGNTTIVYKFAQDPNTAIVVGIHDCEVAIYGADNNRIATPRFTMVVNDRVYRSEDVVVTDEDKTILNEIFASESTRKNNEALRIAKEEDRETNEENRKNAEEIREENEDIREANEANRKENDEKREEAYKEMESRITRNDKRITNLERGIVPDPFYTDDSVAYVKSVPDNALPYAEVNKVGGKVTSIKSKGINLWDEEWYNAVLNENNGIFSEGSEYPVSSKNHIPVQPLTTYCATDEMWIAYYREDKTFIQGAAHWNKEFTPFTTPEGCFFIKFQTIATNYGLTYKNNIAIQKGATASYKPYFGEVFFHIPLEVQVIEGYGQSNPSNATEYNYVDFDKRQFVEYGRIVDGAWVRHENFPVVTDISKIISADNFIEVEGGGTIIAENENKKPVPTEFTYMLEVTA